MTTSGTVKKKSAKKSKKVSKKKVSKKAAKKKVAAKKVVAAKVEVLPPDPDPVHTESETEKLYKKKLAELERKEMEIELQEGLPFLYGWKWYAWAKRFFDSTAKLNFLVAANQISKSSTQIRKALDWATNTDKWQELWPSLPPGQVPNQFWYLYPSGKQALAEFETKWPQFLPQGKYKDDPKYGWKPKYKHGEIYSIEFKSGVTIYFKTYKQNVQLLQSGTVYAIFADEELPVELYDELIFRITAVDGYFHMVFTATLGQDLWRRTMCPGPREKEHLPEAFKQTVSMMDCMRYLDGTRSHWTPSRIKQAIARCKIQEGSG